MNTIEAWRLVETAANAIDSEHATAVAVARAAVEVPILEADIVVIALQNRVLGEVVGIRASARESRLSSGLERRLFNLLTMARGLQWIEGDRP